MKKMMMKYRMRRIKNMNKSTIKKSVKCLKTQKKDDNQRC